MTISVSVSHPENIDTAEAVFMPDITIPFAADSFTAASTNNVYAATVAEGESE